MGIQIFPHTSGCLDTALCLETQSESVFYALAISGLDEDGPIHRPHAEHGRGHGILQHRDRLDLLRIDGQNGTGDAIDQDQWIPSAQGEIEDVCRRFPAALREMQSAHPAVESIQNGWRRGIGQPSSFEIRDGGYFFHRLLRPVQQWIGRVTGVCFHRLRESE